MLAARSFFRSVFGTSGMFLREVGSDVWRMSTKTDPATVVVAVAALSPFPQFWFVTDLARSSDSPQRIFPLIEDNSAHVVKRHPCLGWLGCDGPGSCGGPIAEQTARPSVGDTSVERNVVGEDGRRGKGREEDAGQGYGRHWGRICKGHGAQRRDSIFRVLMLWIGCCVCTVCFYSQANGLLEFPCHVPAYAYTKYVLRDVLNTINTK